ncbi:hypothetical protein L3Q82_005292 [Scortum barcoo]|uniref:Uncharacterized protein n=1 Tax=Scortum barcoo TaxID=214431 RepID=A0ACB8V9T1_9TELE|nr:hypothetical protein L3Q82_005292 [Scortum barcoo]
MTTNISSPTKRTREVMAHAGKVFLGHARPSLEGIAPLEQKKGTEIGVLSLLKKQRIRSILALVPLGKVVDERLCCVVVNPVRDFFPGKRHCSRNLHISETGRNIMLLCKELDRTKKPKAGGLPLDMATDSIDDMFDGCRPEVAPIIHLFAVFEWHFNRKFSFAWASGERNAKKPAHKGLEEDHATVMYMYTKEKNIQQDFNKAVKTGKDEYSTYSFTFHYFYFFLTDAIQVLRHSQTSCRTTYHRTWRRFDHRVIDTNMRFGAFTWGASSKQSFDLNGNVSCFEIISCFGADITHYSATNQMGQVLIPPYEVFKVTDVLTNDPWCSVVYKLQSTRIPRSDLNYSR